MMDPRQECILKAVVEEYVRTAEPVGSKTIASRYGLDVSSATIRNSMAALEKEGFLQAPHTSAGRIPTEAAYVYFLKHFVEPKHEAATEERLRASVAGAENDEAALKTLAKTLVQFSGETAIIAFGPNWSYYTGVSNLFQKPDFQDLEIVQTLSEVVDRFDEAMRAFYHLVTEKPGVLIGSESPFGNQMASILVKYHLPDRGDGVIGLVGPMRMDYATNLGLVEGAKEALDNEDCSYA